MKHQVQKQQTFCCVCKVTCCKKCFADLDLLSFFFSGGEEPEGIKEDIVHHRVGSHCRCLVDHLLGSQSKELRVFMLRPHHKTKLSLSLSLSLFSMHYS